MHREHARTQADDRALILRTQDGHRSAFGELVQRYMERAYFSALGLVGNHEDALDLSQEAFVRAFRARAAIDADRPFYPWLYQIIRRLCFNHTRDRQLHRRKIYAAGKWLAETTLGRGAVRPDVAVERSELRDQVAAALRRLRPHHREIIVLREFQELRYREIAELLEVPVGTVMSRLYTARRSLSDELVAVGIFPPRDPKQKENSVDEAAADSAPAPEPKARSISLHSHSLQPATARGSGGQP